MMIGFSRLMCVLLTATFLVVSGSVFAEDKGEAAKKKEEAKSELKVEDQKTEKKEEEKKSAVVSQRTKVCELELTSNDAMKYSTNEIMVGAECAQLKITLKHVGKLPKTAMGHNLVIAEKSKVDALFAAGLKAGPAKNYIPDSEDILAATKLLGGGESDTITVDVKKLEGKQDLEFFCLFPGHMAAMRGSVKLEGEKKPSS